MLRSIAVALVQPFTALRYDVGRAGPLEDLVAPPYDVIGPAERSALRARSPYNVVHLTLPDSEAEAGRLVRDWQREGVLRRDDEPAIWALSQTYLGPDGVERTRNGLVASLRAEPYSTGAVLPHERTHCGPREGRLRLLREVRAQLEPIFLLYDGEPPIAVPDWQPELDAEGTRLWRLPGVPVGKAFADRQLLIADGHHRYETAVAFGEEQGTPGASSLLAVLVSTSDPGLMIFPTHRVFRTTPAGAPLELADGRLDGPESALQRLEELPREAPAVAVYRDGETHLAVGAASELDVDFVDRLGHEGISYTPDWREAVRSVDAGEAALAVLMRPTRIEDVFAVARGGSVMPQKSTYFYPKLLTGLLLHPL